mgnify:CR=1 FL=1
MKFVLTAKDLQIENIPERGDIAAWVEVDISYDKADIPTYKCSCCAKHAFCSPTPYCHYCGSMMVNYGYVHEVFEKMVQEYREMSDLKKEVAE